MVAALLIAGPTASGKSRLALELAERLDGTIVNADSMQVYRELRVLTARPSPADEARCPHRLYGLRSVAEPCSAGQWLELAQAAIAEAQAAGRLPIVVGGTGLYFRVLTEGLAPVPEIAPELRAELRARLAALGPRAFHAELAARDPETAAMIRPSDPQRLLRAFEVWEATGMPLAEWQRRPVTTPLSGPLLTLALEPPRAELYARCDARFARMMEEGALDEVRGLDAAGFDPALPAMRALGVPHLLRHLRGEIPYAEAVAAAKTATRRYAKRQMTWLRTQMMSWRRLMTQDSESQSEEIMHLLSQGA